MSSSLTPLITATVTVAVRGLVVKHSTATPPQGWKDVARIDFSMFSGRFVVRDASGNKVRIQGLLSGVTEFAAIVESLAPGKGGARAAEKWRTKVRSYGVRTPKQ